MKTVFGVFVAVVLMSAYSVSAYASSNPCNEEAKAVNSQTSKVNSAAHKVESLTTRLDNTKTADANREINAQEQIDQVKSSIEPLLAEQETLLHYCRISAVTGLFSVTCSSNRNRGGINVIGAIIGGIMGGGDGAIIGASGGNCCSNQMARRSGTVNRLIVSLNTRVKQKTTRRNGIIASNQAKEARLAKQLGDAQVALVAAQLKLDQYEAAYSACMSAADAAAV